MNDRGTKNLIWVLRIYGAIGIVYGLVFLLYPGGYAEFAKMQAVDLAKIRYPGGILIAIGYGALQTSKNPEKQGIMVTTLAIAASLIGISLLYSHLVGEYTGSTSAIVPPAVINLLFGALLWGTRQQAKDVL